MKNVVFFGKTSQTGKLLLSNQNYRLTKLIINFFSTFTNSIIVSQLFNLLDEFVSGLLEEKEVYFVFIYERYNLNCLFFLFEETFREEFTLLFLVLFCTHIHCLYIIEVVDHLQNGFVTN